MNILDLRDLAKEMEELIEKLDSDDFGHEDQSRLRELKALENQFSGTLEDAASDEPTLIPEDDWVDYCRDLASELEYLPSSGRKNENPLMNHIDWNSWADEISQDYDQIDFEGRMYYYRDF